MEHRDLIYHGLAIKRHAPASVVADFLALPSSLVVSILDEAVTTGRAVKTGEAYALTALARVALEGRYSLHFSMFRHDPAFVANYEEFERVNKRLKEVITSWQTIEVGGAVIANDHRDKDHDDRIINRLGAVHEEIDPVISALAIQFPRLRIYASRLLHALEAAEDGDTEWVSGMQCESYHTVWFELHEDLLRIMGRARED